MKKKPYKYLYNAAAVLMTLTWLTGCTTEAATTLPSLSEDTEQEPESSADIYFTEESSESISVTADDISIFVSGMNDLYVLQGTEDFDPCALIYADCQIITGLSVDTMDTDFNRTGRYSITYQMNLDEDAYTDFMESPETYEPDFVNASSLVKSFHTPASLECSCAITVVSEPKAKQLVRKGISVYTDNEMPVFSGQKETVSIEDLNLKAKETIQIRYSETENNNSPDPSTTATQSSSTSRNETSEKSTAHSEKTTVQTSETHTGTAEKASNSQTNESHVHNWQPVTKTVHHDAEYTTVHHDAEYTSTWVQDTAAWDEQVCNNDAWDEPVYETHNICSYCGMDLTAAGIRPSDHAQSHAMNGESSGHYTCQVQVGSIHHDATYTTVHHEATGHYENVKTKDEWDEQKLVHAAYDEEVSTGYKCSCGATKTN